MSSSAQTAPPVNDAQLLADVMTCSKMVFYWAVRYGARPRHIEDTEQYSDGWLGLMRAREYYDRRRASGKPIGWKFSSLAFHFIRTEIHKGYQRRRSAARLAVGLEDGILENAFAGDNGRDIEGRTELREYLAGPLDRLRCHSEAQYSAVRFVVMDGLRLEEAGSRQGVTRQRVHQLVRSGLKNLRADAALVRE
jgi:RNA polymerase sigma factor (sigma-70 family)